MLNILIFLRNLCKNASGPGQPGAVAFALAAVLAPAAASAQVGPAPRPTPEQAPPATPQAQSQPGVVPFLFVNQERLLTGSRAGQALLAEEEAARNALRAEAREIDAQFEAEERRLTELRPTLPPEEFRKMADAFDARVIEARQAQDARSEALVQEFDRKRRQFYARVAPLLVALLSQYRAYAIFDESSVLLADQSLNITDAVIAEIDALDAGGDADQTPPDTEADPNAEPDPDTDPAEEQETRP